jgi:segregation and condensation protein B
MNETAVTLSPGLVEAILFAAGEPVRPADIAAAFGCDPSEVLSAIDELARSYQERGGGLEIRQAGGGYRLYTRADHAEAVGHFAARSRVGRLSRPSLETLAIVAYRQPVTRPEIDDIRGVDCGPVLKTLLDRGLVRIIGKKEEVGRPMLYGTTPEFLRVFNLRDLAELPTLREFHELGAEEKAKVDAEHGVTAGAPEAAGVADLAAAAESVFTPHPPLAPDPDEDDGLIEDLERAAQAAARASGAAADPAPPEKTPS